MAHEVEDRYRGGNSTCSGIVEPTDRRESRDSEDGGADQTVPVDDSAMWVVGPWLLKTRLGTTRIDHRFDIGQELVLSPIARPTPLCHCTLPQYQCKDSGGVGKVRAASFEVLAIKILPQSSASGLIDSRPRHVAPATPVMGQDTRKQVGFLHLATPRQCASEHCEAKKRR